MTSKKVSASDMRIAEMKADDLSEIMSIEKVSFPTPWSENMFRKELRTSMSRSFVVRTVAERKDSLVGYINFWIFADEVHLNNIAVRQDYRKMGIAAMMLREMIILSWNEGAQWGTLEVRMRNIDAIRLYERYGYEVQGRRPNYYYDSNEDALIMWCNLEEAMTRVSRHDA